MLIRRAYVLYQSLCGKCAKFRFAGQTSYTVAKLRSYPGIVNN